MARPHRPHAPPPRALPPPPKKGRKRTPLERRTAAVQATVKEFTGKRFSFRLKRDCGRMAQFHLKALGRPVHLSKLGSYSDAAGAKAALERCGFADLPALLDAKLERIPFARILPGDFVQLEAEEGPLAEIGALAIWMGNGAAFMYHEHAIGAVPATLVEDPIAAWSVLP